MKKCLVYIHPAIPPANIQPYVWYTLEELLEMFTMDQIKTFFRECNFSWSQLEENNDVKEVKSNKAK